jgi:hypothetical protein
MSKETIDEKLVAAGIEVPAETPQAVKEMLLAKHEEAQALAEEKEALTKEATAENAQLRKALKDAKIEVNTNKGFGSFKLDGKTYDITMAATQVLHKDSKQWETITAEKLVKDKDLQKRVVAKGYGIAKVKGGK